MKLDVFISESIVQLTKGLLKAQEQISMHGVNLKTGGAAAGYSKIDFDVAVTTKNDTDLGGKASLNVFGIDINASKGGQESLSEVSRIKFSVQYSIPQEEMKLAMKKGKNLDRLV